MDHAAILARLEATITERAKADPSASYVAKLHAKGLGKIAQKLGEEAVETVIAALSEGEAELVGEAADLLFHLMVLLGAKGVAFDAVADLCELSARQDPSLRQLADGGAVKIAACFPRAVKWLFHAAQADLPPDGAEVLNMRELSAEAVTEALFDAEIKPNLPQGKIADADAPKAAAA